jgi:aryl-alcohol dehydrogenase-like predicted oxidoreductase
MEPVLGAMYFGTKVDAETSFRVLDEFVERGGTWIDTANAYSFWSDPSGVGGQSEETIGRWLAGRPGIRERVRISTKVRWQPTVPGKWPESAEGLSTAAIRDAVALSLRRLGTDRIDLYWAHGEDRSVPLEETVAAFGALVADGTVERLGASNHAIWRLERSRAVAAAQGVAGYTAVQLRQSYVEPRPGAPLPDEGHLLATPEAHDYVREHPELMMWAYTSLLNGAYVRADRPIPEAYDHPGTTRRLAALAEVAAETGLTRNQVVLSWLMGGDPPVSPIVGVSTVEQLTEAMDAASVALSPEHRSRLDDRS